LAEDPFVLAAEAADVLRRKTGVDSHDLVVVLGSGWAGLAPMLGEGTDVPMAELPGFSSPSVLGHAAGLRSVEIGGRPVLLALGRVHLYEGHPPGTVVHAVRVAAAAGCTIAVLTNASGSLHTEWPIGRPVLISDQINFTGLSPLTGPAVPDRFTPMGDAYAPRLRALATAVAPELREGVYMGFHGPELESPAEIRAARALGADLVGMSTVLETIAARHAGLEVLGLSLVTNLASGLGAVPLDPGHIYAAAAEHGEAAGRLAAAVLQAVVRGR
jgi:purine-nucleoside phosphorylase